MTEVSLLPLKEKAIYFPENVRRLILNEPDLMDSTEFIIKLGQWDRLLAMHKETG